MSSELELRRWCIEQAVKWPFEPGSSFASATIGVCGSYKEADVIGRAERLLSWVKTETPRVLVRKRK